MDLLTAAPILITGTQRMLTAVSGGLTGIIVIATVVAGVYNFIKMQGADEQEVPRIKGKIKGIVGAGIIATCFSGLITWIFAFYR